MLMSRSTPGGLLSTRFHIYHKYSGLTETRLIYGISNLDDVLTPQEILLIIFLGSCPCSTQLAGRFHGRSCLLLLLR
jgi:hypothetical protein